MGDQKMLRRFLPYVVQRELFGDRRRYGARPDPADPDWLRYQACFDGVYRDTQRGNSLLSRVNDAGYDVLKEVDLDGLSVAEIGPGRGYHFGWFKGRPRAYHAIDANATYPAALATECARRGFPFQFHHVAHEDPRIPLAEGSQDIVLSFYSLEHLRPFAAWMQEIFRVLKPGGRLVGAIPAEGGVAWGTGRWLTSRRTLRDRYGLDIRKIICWEHPNFADEILSYLASQGSVRSRSWPLPHVPLDLNLVVKFQVEKPREA